MKRILKNGFDFYFFCSFYLIFIVIVLLFVSDLDNDSNIGLADGFSINSYNVILDVKDDNKIDVTENIVVNFSSDTKHGIYKFTPTWLEYTDKNGKVIKRNSTISNYRAVGDPYSLDTVKSKERIKIGNASEYVRLGEKLYTIKYTYDMGRDPFKGFDEFIFHAYGDYWGTTINNASMQVNMPKSIEGSSINFFTDKYRKNNVNDVVDYYVKGNVLYVKFDNTKKLDKALTVDIELPEGYFVGGSWNYGFFSFLISLIIFILTGMTIYKWFKYGRNYQKEISVVEFYPPDNLSAAEIGYIYGNKSSKKLTISLIVQLASKGYIKIDEIDSNNGNIRITNLIVKPKSVKSNKVPKRAIKVLKLKEYDDILLPSEVTMMKYLFKNSDVKIVNANIDKFLQVKDSLVNKGYIKVLEDNNDLILNDTLAKEYENKLKQYEIDMEKYNKKLSILAKLTKLEQIVYNRLFEVNDVVFLNTHPSFYKAFDEVESELYYNLQDKIYDNDASNQVSGSVFRCLLILIFNIISYKYIEDMDPNWNIIYVLSFLCVIVSLFFTIFMGRRTKYGEVIGARVKGFRDFLVTAEKKKLEALVLTDPNYFYNILPYTYALNISKAWIKKFENIPIPKIDMGNFNYSSDYAYYCLYNNVYYPPTVSSRGSSSCSSCGGGCSSCGGGCSSCGGGGSW